MGDGRKGMLLCLPTCFPVSVNQLQGELNLARRSGGLADDAKAASAQNVGRQPEIYQVENIEELGAKFHRPQLRASPMPERSVFDQRDVEVLESRSAKGVAPQRAETPMVGTGAARNVDRNREE